MGLIALPFTVYRYGFYGSLMESALYLVFTYNKLYLNQNKFENRVKYSNYFPKVGVKLTKENACL